MRQVRRSAFRRTRRNEICRQPRLDARFGIPAKCHPYRCEQRSRSTRSSCGKGAAVSSCSGSAAGVAPIAPAVRYGKARAHPAFHLMPRWHQAGTPLPDAGIRGRCAERSFPQPFCASVFVVLRPKAGWRAARRRFSATDRPVRCRIPFWLPMRPPAPIDARHGRKPPGHWR